MFADKVNFNEVEREDDLGHKVNFNEVEREGGLDQVYSYENELIYTGLQKGLSQGLSQGRDEKAIEVAKSGFANNINIETIVLLTGLEESVVLNLQEEFLKNGK